MLVRRKQRPLRASLVGMRHAEFQQGAGLHVVSSVVKQPKAPRGMGLVIRSAGDAGDSAKEHRDVQSALPGILEAQQLSADGQLPIGANSAASPPQPVPKGRMSGMETSCVPASASLMQVKGSPKAKARRERKARIEKQRASRKERMAKAKARRRVSRRGRMARANLRVRASPKERASLARTLCAHVAPMPLLRSEPCTHPPLEGFV